MFVITCLKKHSLLVQRRQGVGFGRRLFCLPKLTRHNEAVASEPPPDLADLLRAEIRAQGPIPVSRWMEVSLYHPELGYYRRGRNPFGAHGDFYTAEQLQPFADMLATVAASLARQAEMSAHAFSILELGAGRRDLRHALAPWPYLAHDWDQPQLPDAMAGLVLANEFFDALPVRVLRRDHNRWYELAVENAGGRFQLIRAPWPLRDDLLTYADSYASAMPAESVLEVSETSAFWLHHLGARLRWGRLLIFDYGYLAADLPRFGGGTLMSYRNHIALNDILQAPGTRDITAHVNFSAIIEQAEQHGFKLDFNRTLRQWALDLWTPQELEHRWEGANTRWRMQWKQLVFGLGETFRVVQLARAPAKMCP